MKLGWGEVENCGKYEEHGSFEDEEEEKTRVFVSTRKTEGERRLNFSQSFSVQGVAMFAVAWGLWR